MWQRTVVVHASILNCIMLKTYEVSDKQVGGLIERTALIKGQVTSYQ